MEKLYCSIHKLNINIYSKEEENLFIDDNSQETVLFYDEDGKRYLKRFMVNKCDKNCSTIQEILSNKK